MVQLTDNGNINVFPLIDGICHNSIDFKTVKNMLQYIHTITFNGTMSECLNDQSSLKIIKLLRLFRSEIKNLQKFSVLNCICGESALNAMFAGLSNARLQGCVVFLRIFFFVRIAIFF